MNKLLINDIEYDVSSPIDEEYIKQYRKSFEDFIHPSSPEVSVRWLHVDGFELHLTSDSEDNFFVQISDDTNKVIHETTLRNGMFCKLNRKYYNGIRYKIFHNDNLIKNEKISFENKRVYISFDSKSLGDTISWVAYCEEFRKHHNCELIVSTFNNQLFEKSYPEIQFVKPGTVVSNIFGMFILGWFYNKDREPVYPPSIPLQKAASNILGLDYTEIQTNVYFQPYNRPTKDKYICIATNSTAGCKIWNYPNGWEILSKKFIDMGYKVINISKDGDKIPGVINLKNDSLTNTMNSIYHSEFVIGLSSGLSWLSWGLGKHVVMISNFTEPDHEFTNNCTRITNPNVCNGCWNNPAFKFDKGDWNWCPEHKGTERHFECHKSITPDMVMEQINKWL